MDDSKIKKLTELAQLYREGILTQEELEREKRKILDKNDISKTTIRECKNSKQDNLQRPSGLKVKDTKHSFGHILRQKLSATTTLIKKWDVMRWIRTNKKRIALIGLGIGVLGIVIVIGISIHETTSQDILNWEEEDAPAKSSEIVYDNSAKSKFDSITTELKENGYTLVTVDNPDEPEYYVYANDSEVFIGDVNGKRKEIFKNIADIDFIEYYVDISDDGVMSIQKYKKNAKEIDSHSNLYDNIKWFDENNKANILKGVGNWLVIDEKSVCSIRDLNTFYPIDYSYRFEKDNLNIKDLLETNNALSPLSINIYGGEMSLPGILDYSWKNEDTPIDIMRNAGQFIRQGTIDKFGNLTLSDKIEWEGLSIPVSEVTIEGMKKYYARQTLYE